MKRFLLTTTLLLAMIYASGCTGAESFAGGAGTVGVLDALTKQARDTQTQEYFVQAELTKQLTVANSESEKALLNAQLANSRRRQDNASVRENGSAVTQKLLGLDYKDPESLIPVLAGLFLAYREVKNRKKNIGLNSLLTATNKGIDRFKAKNSSVVSGELYDSVKHEQRKAGVLREVTLGDITT